MTRRVLVFDTNVLIYLLQDLYEADKRIFAKVMQFITLEFPTVWIPPTVKS